MKTKFAPLLIHSIDQDFMGKRQSHTVLCTTVTRGPQLVPARPPTSRPGGRGPGWQPLRGCHFPFPTPRNCSLLCAHIYVLYYFSLSRIKHYHCVLRFSVPGCLRVPADKDSKVPKSHVGPLPAPSDFAPLRRSRNRCAILSIDIACFFLESSY